MKDNSGKVLLALLAGASAGVVAGLLMAPDAGTATRETLGKSLGKFGDDLNKLLQDGLSRLDALKGSGGAAGSEGDTDRAGAEDALAGLGGGAQGGSGSSKGGSKSGGAGGASTAGGSASGSGAGASGSSAGGSKGGGSTAGSGSTSGGQGSASGSASTAGGSGSTTGGGTASNATDAGDTALGGSL